MLPAGASLADTRPLRLWRQPSARMGTRCAGAADSRTAACVADADWVHGSRALPHTAWIGGPRGSTTTQEGCASACHAAGFAFAGVEAWDANYGGEGGP